MEQIDALDIEQVLALRYEQLLAMPPALFDVIADKMNFTGPPGNWSDPDYNDWYNWWYHHYGENSTGMPPPPPPPPPPTGTSGGGGNGGDGGGNGGNGGDHGGTSGDIGGNTGGGTAPYGNGDVSRPMNEGITHGPRPPVQSGTERPNVGMFTNGEVRPVSDFDGIVVSAGPFNDRPTWLPGDGEYTRPPQNDGSDGGDGTGNGQSPSGGHGGDGGDSGSSSYDPFAGQSGTEDRVDALPATITSENVQDFLQVLSDVPATDIASKLTADAVS